jgi:hypothetical protein
MNIENQEFTAIFNRNYLSAYLSTYGSTALVDLGRFFSFVTFYTVDRPPWTRDKPVAARPLPTNKTAQTQNKRTHRYP